MGRNCKNTNSARNFCNTAVTSAVSVANRASGIAYGIAQGIAVQAQKVLTVVEKNLKIAAQNALSDVTIKFTALGQSIQCALPLQPKGLAALMASRANSLPRRSGFLACTTC